MLAVSSRHFPRYNFGMSQVNIIISCFRYPNLSEGGLFYLLFFSFLMAKNDFMSSLLNVLYEEIDCGFNRSIAKNVWQNISSVSVVACLFLAYTSGEEV